MLEPRRLCTILPGTRCIIEARHFKDWKWDDLKTRLIAAERTSAAALDEVIALRGEIDEMKDAFSLRQDTTMRDSDHEVEDVHQDEYRSEGDGVNINDGGNQTILPEYVTPEVDTVSNGDQSPMWWRLLLAEFSNDNSGLWRVW